VPLKPRHRKTNITQQLDCIDEGLVSEAEARELVQL
jgi:hypothetical protein